MSNQYEKFANQFLNVVSRDGDEWAVLCPFHNDSSPSLSFNVSKGLFICYGCGAKGSAAKMAKMLGQDGYVPEVDLEGLLKQLHPETDQIRVLPESWLAQYNDPVQKPWRKRGISDPVAKRLGLGYDHPTDSMTIPLRDSTGRLLGVCFRRLDPDVRPKYVYPRGFKASSNLYGSWLIGPSTRAVGVVEGPMDVAACLHADVPAVALYGSRISERQVKILQRSNLDRVVTLTDQDEAGQKARERVTEAMDGTGILVVNVTWDKSMGKDPGELPPPYLASLWREAIVANPLALEDQAVLA